MKKYFLTIAFLVTIPSITLASWWNPFSWRIFSASVQTNPPTQINNSVTSSNEVLARPTLTPASTTTSTTPVNKPASKVASNSPKPTVAPSTSSQVKQSTQSKVIEKSNQPIKVSTPIIQTQTTGTLCNGTYWSQCPTGQKFICPQNGNAYCQLPQQPALQPQTTQQKQTTSRRPISTPANQVQNTVNQSTKEVSSGGVQNSGSVQVSPTSVQGGTTATFTITAPGDYHFGTGTGNTGREACVTSGNKQACVGRTSSNGTSLTKSADSKILTYTSFIPDNLSSSFQIMTNGLYDTNDKSINGGSSNWFITVKNSDPAFETGKAVIVNNSATPSGQATITDASNGTYQGLIVQVFDITGMYQNLHLNKITAHISMSGTGTVTAAQLSIGGLMYSGALANNVATFDNLNVDISGTRSISLKLDVGGVNSASPLSITTSINGSDVEITNQAYNPVVTSGSAVGNTITVVGQ